MVSRILGLVREMIFAYFFGASKSFAYDAFVIAFRIPNMLRDLFAEGALSVAFVTVFSDYLVTRGRDEARRLSNLVTTALLLILGAVVLLGMLFAPQIVTLLAPGFTDNPEKIALSVRLTRIMMPFILLVAMSAKSMGVLNSTDRFAAPALASSFFNVGSIIGGVILAAFLADPSFSHPVNAILSQPTVAIIGMAYGVLIGGFFQYLVQWPSLKSAGFRFKPAFSLKDPGVRRILKLMGPAAVGAAAFQVNIVINSNFASSLPGNGPVSWLAYAFRFMQFPIGVFGVAIATATLPVVARNAALREMDEFRRTLASSLRLGFLLTIPSAAGLVVLGRPIVALIYQHGGFTASDTRHTAAALSCYAIGLAGYAAVQILAPAFYAMGDARTPMFAALLSVAVNYFMNWALVHPLQERGLALSTSTVALANFALLYGVMRKRIGGIEDRRNLWMTARVVAASALMAVCCYLIGLALSRLVTGADPNRLSHKVLDAFVPVIAGAGVFYVLAYIFGIRELRTAWAAVAKKLGLQSRGV